MRQLRRSHEYRKIRQEAPVTVSRSSITRVSIFFSFAETDAFSLLLGRGNRFYTNRKTFSRSDSTMKQYKTSPAHFPLLFFSLLCVSRKKSLTERIATSGKSVLFSFSPSIDRWVLLSDTREAKVHRLIQPSMDIDNRWLSTHAFTSQLATIEFCGLHVKELEWGFFRERITFLLYSLKEQGTRAALFTSHRCHLIIITQSVLYCLSNDVVV